MCTAFLEIGCLTQGRLRRRAAVWSGFGFIPAPTDFYSKASWCVAHCKCKCKCKEYQTSQHLI